MVSPAGCDPFDGFVLAHRQRRVRRRPTARSSPRWKRISRCSRGLGLQAYIEIADLRRHAVRPLPGSQSAGIPRASAALRCRSAPRRRRQPAAVPDRGRRLQSRAAADRHARPPARHGSVLRHQPEQPQSEFPQCALRQLPRRRHADRQQHRQQQPADDDGLRSGVPHAGNKLPRKPWASRDWLRASCSRRRSTAMRQDGISAT